MDLDWKDNKNAASAMHCATVLFEGDRAERDYYATDPKATEFLCGLEQFNTNIWEPACGGGHIANVLKAHGYTVRESDVVDRIGNEVLDFLTVDPAVNHWHGDIVTNPPYSKAKEFVQKALDVIDEGAKLAMFLKLTFLESAGRRELFRENPPIRVWVSSGRLRCWKNGEKTGFQGNMMCFAWFVWEKGFKGDPALKWFN